MTAPPDEQVSGILLVDKPEGPTSHDVVQRARRALGTRRVGHTGTLDPFASGLLLLCAGRATRLAELFHLLPKRYLADVELGLETTTHDRTGDPAEPRGSWVEVSREGLAKALAALTGELSQVPPAFSAKKLDGTRAHRLARAGTAVELPPVRVVVHSIEVTVWSPPLVSLDLWVSTGTYVRALARDLGRTLGCGAHLAGLRRTRIGPFDVSDGVRLDGPGAPLDASRQDLLPARSALAWLPQRELSRPERVDVSHGRPIAEGVVQEPDSADWPAPARDRWPVALGADRALVAVARRGEGLLHPVKVLHAT